MTAEDFSLPRPVRARQTLLRVSLASESCAYETTVISVYSEDYSESLGLKYISVRVPREKGKIRERDHSVTAL